MVKVRAALRGLPRIRESWIEDAAGWRRATVQGKGRFAERVHCLISTKNGADAYDVEVEPSWLDEPDNWNFPARGARTPQAKDGTSIHVSELYDGVSRTFGEGGRAFEKELYTRISEQYAFIIAKGLQVKVNSKTVTAKPTKLVLAQGKKPGKPEIAPFVFKTRIDQVDVFLAIGLTRPLPTSEEVKEHDENPETQYRSIGAGWTVVCNDRAVVYCDRTEVTGWGEAGIPRYHTQFIAISGIVEFRALDSLKLPTTTTKRGIDGSSRLYLQVKNKMRDGLRVFIKYAYGWRGREAEARGLIEAHGRELSFEEVKAAVSRKELPMKKATRFDDGAQFKPTLPRPPEVESDLRRISYERRVRDIRKVGKYVLDEPDAKPGVVGEACFDRLLREARQE